MDETIPELHPLPKEPARRRRWWPFCRKRDCEVRVTLLQVRFRSHQALVSSDGKADVKFTVDGAQGESQTMGEQDTATPVFEQRLLRPGRCDSDIQLAFALQIAFRDPLNYGLQARRVLDTVRTYRCPGHVDHEVLSIRDENPNAWYEFQFDFRIELGCA